MGASLAALVTSTRQGLVLAVSPLCFGGQRDRQLVGLVISPNMTAQEGSVLVSQFETLRETADKLMLHAEANDRLITDMRTTEQVRSPVYCRSGAKG